MITRRPLPGLVASAALLVLAAGHARADLIPWTAQTFGPGDVTFDSNWHGDTLTFHYVNVPGEQHFTGDADVTLAVLKGTSGGLESGAPPWASFTSTTVAYTIILRDDRSKQQAFLNFGGELEPSGAFDFVSSIPPVTLGGNLYAVQVNSAVDAAVTVTPGTPAAPEPSAMLLAALGAGLAGTAVWRRRGAAAVV